MGRVLKKEFFEQPADVVARDLLGAVLAVKQNGSTERYKIVETEAYVGAQDKASHASRGRTERTEVMFGPPGYWYVYLVYGTYHMLNIVTDKEDHPSAVLIRGVEDSKRGRIDGPGKLTKALGIDKRFNSKSATHKTGLWIEVGERVPEKKVKKTPRIGVDYAGEWAKKELRFVATSDKTKKSKAQMSNDK